MPRFYYSYMRPDGAIAHATGDAEDEITLSARLQREKCYLLRVGRERSIKNWLANTHLTSGRSSLVLALHELGTLVKAGVPVDRGLAVIAELLPAKNLRAALLRIRDEVRRGTSLADAMDAEPSHFSALHVNLVRAGEVVGALDEALVRLAAHLRQQDALRSQVQTAMVYPAILMAVGVMTLILLATVVLPQLAPVFEDAGRQMPLSTRVIMGSAEILRQFGWLIAIALSIIIVFFRQSLKQPSRRVWWDRLKLRIPFIGPTILVIQTARFARTAGTLLKAGVALPVALGHARTTLTNRAMDDALRIATLKVRSGGTLTDALQSSGLFPALSIQLISVGEETGHVDDMLLHQAEFFERSGARRIETLVAVLGPAMTLLIGTGVASISASILLAVMRLNQLAS